MPYRLTRQVFLNAVACPRLGWFSRLDNPPHELEPEQGSLAGRYLLQEGRDVHARARVLFPNASTVTRQAYEAACWQTQDLMDHPSTHTILEAAFGTSTCRARPDAVVRLGEDWRVCEVKTTLNRTRALVDDLGFSWMVLNQAGVNLGGASLILLSRDYRPGMPDEALFTTVDVSREAAARASEFRGLVDRVDEMTRGTEPPPPAFTTHCGACPLFRSCAGKGIEHPVFDLPHLTPARLRRLIETGVTKVQDITDASVLTPRQTLAWQSILKGEITLTGDLRGNLAAVSWPARYLDFQTVATAIPLFPDLAPLEPFPFVYSVRTCDQPGRVRSHKVFLSPHNRDASEDMAERLLQDAGQDGSIIVYSPREARVIRWLANRIPGLASHLRALLPRVVELESIIRRDVYHPGFRGKLSLQAVLPALVPDFSYIDLEIEESATEAATFAYLARGGYYSEERAPLARRDLAAYCARDTLALVEVHEALHRLAGA